MTHTEGSYSYEPGRTYVHHKGNRYRVLCLARHTETGEDLVVYQALYGEHGMWARPRTMFEESVEKNGETVPRFALQPEA
ncbi:DUF1653 domain-containing protein [Streptomyces sp. J2-1]|uniref:DUF1653 domain-containing protein n=1 Tax=Streptomyces corallincola TaxID=2851888 RepID=UPI001C3945BC|nr:DUF1653 domain-containing protein [Streptomyces corallincola]MBV2353889.1 DUF1653 domain-containing protein [Streptomyces corallincola]